MVRSTFAALLGAIIVFAWGFASWMILPWHNWDMKSFKDDGKMVAEALKAEATDSGLYVLPNIVTDMHAIENQKQFTDKAQNEQQWAEKAHKGPFAYLVMNPNGMKWDMQTALVYQFLIQLITAFIAVWLLNRSSLRSWLPRAIFVSFSVTLGAFLCSASNWNWWGFPLTSSVVNMADPLIGWFIAGLFMAKIAR